MSYTYHWAVDGINRKSASVAVERQERVRGERLKPSKVPRLVRGVWRILRCGRRMGDYRRDDCQRRVCNQKTWSPKSYIRLISRTCSAAVNINVNTVLLNPRRVKRSNKACKNHIIGRLYILNLALDDTLIVEIISP